MDNLTKIRERAAEQKQAQLTAALEKHGGNIAKTARELGISRYRIYRLLSKRGEAGK